MSEQSLVAVYLTLAEAEQAVRLLAQAKFPMEEISLVAKELVAKEIPQEKPEQSGLGHAKHLAKRGVRVAIGAAMISFPGVVAATLTGGAAGAVVGTVLGDIVKALGAKGPLVGRILGYEEAVKGGKFLVIAHGSSAEIEQAREILFKTSPSELTLHSEEAEDPVTPPAQQAEGEN
jgi:hypothetical protein